MANEIGRSNGLQSETNEGRGFELLYSQAEIDQAVLRLASEINTDFRDSKSLVLVGVLKGAFVFLSDLVRYITVPIEVDFVRLMSYRGGSESSGTVSISKDIEVDISGRDVVIVEEIVDTGRTLDFLVKRLISSNPKALKVCALLDKAEARAVAVQIDYLGLTVENYFLIGYGLDYGEKYRNLPGIYRLTTPQNKAMDLGINERGVYSLKSIKQ